MDPHSLKTLNAERRAGRGVVLVTDLGDGRDRVVRAGDAVAGELGAALAHAFEAGASRMVDIAGRSFFLDVHLPRADHDGGSGKREAAA